MLDHLFLDTVATVKAALDASLLDRTGQDDRLVFDLLSGDLLWESAVNLPGETDPPRVGADISLDWQTWSQSAWRSLAMGEVVEDPPEIGVEIVFRLQRLATRPPLAALLDLLPPTSPEIGGDTLARSAPVIEEAYEEESLGPEVAVEIGYEGSLSVPAPHPMPPEVAGSGLFQTPAPTRLGQAETLGAQLGATRQLSAAVEASVAALGAWVASTLVRLADLELDYLHPPEQPET